MSSNYRTEYMKNLQNKTDYANSINPKTYDFSNSGFRNTFYNDQENGFVGSRQNKPSDYTTTEQRTSNSMKNISTSNAFMKKR